MSEVDPFCCPLEVSVLKFDPNAPPLNAPKGAPFGTPPGPDAPAKEGVEFELANAPVAALPFGTPVALFKNMD